MKYEHEFRLKDIREYEEHTVWYFKKDRDDYPDFEVTDDDGNVLELTEDEEKYVYQNIEVDYEKRLLDYHDYMMTDFKHEQWEGRDG